MSDDRRLKERALDLFTGSWNDNGYLTNEMAGLAEARLPGRATPPGAATSSR